MKFFVTSIFRRNKGVSLIIAIIYVSALMLIMAGLFEVNIKMIQMKGDWNMSDNARNLAESALEMAGLYASQRGIGINAASSNLPVQDVSNYTDFMFAGAERIGIQNCADMDGDGTNGDQPCTGFEVKGRPVDAEKISFNGSQYFSAPISGSGDAAKDCDSWSAPGVADPALNRVNADNPCHWNRMYIGNTMEIPLYYENADGSVTKLDFGAGSAEEFRLRVRTPACAAGSAGCSADGRLILYPSVTAVEGGENPDYRNPDRDPVLVQWSVFDGGGSGVVTAWDETAEGKRQVGLPYRNNNTEISAGRINLANIFGVLDEQFDHLENFTVLKYLNNVGAEEFDKHSGKKASDKQRQLVSEAINGYTKPTLRLSLVGQPQRHFSALDGQPFVYPADLNSREEFDIPYLEYQLLTKNSPASGEKTLIIGWAEIGGFRKKFRKYIKRATSASGFAIESF